MKSLISMTILSIAVGACGCSPQAQEKMDDAIGAAGDAASDAAGDASEAVGNAAEALEEAKDKGMAAISEKASAALAGIEGGPELLAKVTDFFSSAGDALKGVKDTETAQAAAGKLNELGGSLEGLSAAMEKLPEEARVALAGVFESGIAGLQALMEKAAAIPGVQDVIKPKFDEMMQKLSAMTGKQTEE